MKALKLCLASVLPLALLAACSNVDGDNILDNSTGRAVSFNLLDSSVSTATYTGTTTTKGSGTDQELTVTGAHVADAAGDGIDDGQGLATFTFTAAQDLYLYTGLTFEYKADNAGNVIISDANRNTFCALKPSGSGANWGALPATNGGWATYTLDFSKLAIGFRLGTSTATSLDTARVTSVGFVYGDSSVFSVRNFKLIPLTESAVASRKVSSPSFSISSGSVMAYTPITVSREPSNATVYYTTDGSSTPTTSSSSITGSTFSFTTPGTYTVRAFAAYDGMQSSDVISTQTITVTDFTGFTFSDSYQVFTPGWTGSGIASTLTTDDNRSVLYITSTAAWMAWFFTFPSPVDLSSKTTVKLVLKGSITGDGVVAFGNSTAMSPDGGWSGITGTSRAALAASSISASTYSTISLSIPAESKAANFYRLLISFYGNTGTLYIDSITFE